jgi:hypothetical protein
MTRPPSRWLRSAGGEAAVLAETEYQRFLDLMRSLSPDEWSVPTECPAWDVRAMSGHVLGMITCWG